MTSPLESDSPPYPGDPSALDRTFAVPYTHRVRFTRDVFAEANPVLRKVLAEGRDSTGRAVVFVDDAVADAWPKLETAITRYAAAHADLMTLAGPIRRVPGGEIVKNDPDHVRRMIEAIDVEGICRHSFVFAVGGGAVLDAVGYAAATAHRGVRLIRFPTTTLAQGDAGIGVKNGINAHGKKNFLGAFNVPCAVLNDAAFLTTLSDRDWRAGLSEAVKVALLKDAPFYRRIANAAARLRRRDETAADPIIHRSAELHLDHIAFGGDPFERENARPLDFGHWSAHKMEQMTNFELRHGEAVAIGIALDTVYSVLTKRLKPSDAEDILDTLTAIGFSLTHPCLADRGTLLDGLEEFREHLGGRLTITLLEGIGRDVDVHHIDRDTMCAAIDHLVARAATRHAG
ncbi:MAG: 3-dehydroquinate synthase [Phycisphaerae bacterium]|nr:3-dehydroquinate synthase [Phycisphaerae bacterium]